MRIRFNPRWLLVPALLFSLQFCRAQVEVPPVVSFDLGSPDAPETQLWDVGGNYSLDLLIAQKNTLQTAVRLTFNLVQDANGKLSSPTNDFFETLQIGDNSFFVGLPKISGKVTGSGGTARVHFTVKFSGNGTLAGQTVNSMKASLTVDAETDPVTGTLEGTKISKFSASFSGFPGISGTMGVTTPAFSTPMPNGTNGSWDLSMQIAALSKVTGTALLTTPSRPLGYDLSGSFKKGTFNIKAKGANDVPDSVSAVGSSAKIQMPDTLDSLLFNGKVLGQKLFFSTGATPQ